MEIKEVKSKQDLREFIHLPERIHKNHKEWLPPLLMDEKKLFSEKRNPAFKHCDTILLLAIDDKKAVGRIMGIIPHKFNDLNGVKNVRFAFIECDEDKIIFDALIKAVEDWGNKNACDEIVGPMAFSDKEPQGFVVNGFEGPTMMVTNCNFPFMPEYILQNNYSGYVDLCQYEVPINQELVDRFKPFAKRVIKYNQLTVHDFTSTRQIKPYIHAVFDLINKTYQEIYGFSALTKEEMSEFANRFLPLLNPRLIKIITNSNGKVVAAVIAMADLSEGIKKGRGRLFPTGWWHLLKANKKSNRLVLLLGGIDQDMRNKGLDAVLGQRLLNSALMENFRMMDSHLIMKDNYKMRREIERLGGCVMYKEYTIFKKVLN
nr:hypothetical protein [uncultured Carboxylicivirga sp.]